MKNTNELEFFKRFVKMKRNGKENPMIKTDLYLFFLSKALLICFEMTSSLMEERAAKNISYEQL